MKQQEIAREILEDYDFEIVILVTVDKNRRLKVSGSNSGGHIDELTTTMMTRILETVRHWFLKDKPNTVH